MTLADPPVIPRGDGAPGEGQEPQFFVQPEGEPAQVFLQAPPGIQPLDRVQAEDGNGESRSNLDEIDRRAPVRKARQSVWQKAAASAQNSQWDDVLRFLDQWHDRAADEQYEDSLVRLPNGTIQSGRLESARLLLRLPEELRRQRERQLGGRARSQLEEAGQSSDLNQLSQVASRFFGTLAGYDAANRLASQLLDRGDFALAARWIQLLQEADAPVTRNESWNRRAQLILSITGQLGESDDAPASAGENKSVAGVASQLMTSQPQLVDDWRLPGGNAQRHARPSGDAPVLIPRWTLSTVSSPRLQDTIAELMESLARNREASIPAAEPICVDGKIVARTVHGIDVVDAASGRRLWSTSDRTSVERLLDNSKFGRPNRTANPFAMVVPGIDYEAEVSQEAAGPLSQFLFQNAGQGLISSDGHRVYSIDDDPILILGRTSIRNQANVDEAPEPGNGTSNRLTACDLSSGRIAWQVGGPATGAPLKHSLSGMFFMGAPVPAGDDLFVVGMKGRDIRLVCLSADTGELRWSQLLAFADHQPDSDLVRRLWSVQPAVAHGVVVCPTSVGWLVAVDRSTGTLLWAHRYHTKKRAALTPSFDPFGGAGMPSMATEPINTRWATSPPIIAGRRVYVTPAESKTPDDPTSGIIACLDLFSGERIWRKSRNKGRYLAGVHGDLAIVVENDAVAAYGRTGRIEWDVDLSNETGAPSGRGVITGNSLWLPTQKLMLLRIDLDQGTIADRLEVIDSSDPLGNLAMYRGLLISHHATGLQAFEQAAALEQRLAAARADNRHDPVTALLDARLALSRGEAGRAISVLKHSLSIQPTPAIRDQLKNLLAEAVIRNLKQNPEESLSLVRELDGPGQSDEALRHRQLAIEVLLRTGHPDEALSRLLHIETSESSKELPLIGDSRVTVALNAWVEERLATAWSQLSASRRSTSSELIDQRLTVDGLTDAERLARARQFAFFPKAASLELDLSRRAIDDERFADAEVSLERLADSGDPEIALAALLLEIELGLLHFVDHHDLVDKFDRARRLLQAAENDGPVAERLQALRQKFDRTAAQFGSNEEARWRTPLRPHVQLTRSGGSHSKLTTLDIDPVSEDPPAGSRFRLRISGQSNARRLSLMERHSGDIALSVLLRGNSGGGRSISVRRTGSLLLVLNRGVLHCLSIRDRRLLWVRPVEQPDSPTKSPRSRAVSLESGPDWLNRVSGSPNDPLPLVTSRITCTRGRKTVTVYDTLTGQLLWKLEPAPRTGRVLASGSLLCLVRRDGEVSAAFDARSGRPQTNGPQQLHPPLANFSDRTVSSSLDELGELITISCRQHDSETELWSREFEADFSFGQVGRHRLAIMRDRGRFAVLNLRTGQLQEFDRIPASLRIGKSNFSVLRDEYRWYVILNGEVERDYRAPSLRSVVVAGHVVAFDAGTGEQLWKRSLSDQFLILDHFTSSPFLLTLAPSSSPLGVPGEKLNVTLIHKAYGEVLHQQSLPGMISVHSMRMVPQSTFIELIAHGDRIRLSIEGVEAP